MANTVAIGIPWPPACAEQPEAFQDTGRPQRELFVLWDDSGETMARTKQDSNISSITGETPHNGELDLFMKFRETALGAPYA